MAYQWFIGIDVSKQTLDITVLSGGEKKMYEQIQNSGSAIKAFLKKLSAESKGITGRLRVLSGAYRYLQCALPQSDGRKEIVCLPGVIRADQAIRRLAKRQER